MTPREAYEQAQAKVLELEQLLQVREGELADAQARIDRTEAEREAAAEELIALPTAGEERSLRAANEKQAAQLGLIAAEKRVERATSELEKAREASDRAELAWIIVRAREQRESFRAPMRELVALARVADETVSKLVELVDLHTDLHDRAKELAKKLHIPNTPVPDVSSGAVRVAVGVLLASELGESDVGIETDLPGELKGSAARLNAEEVSVRPMLTGFVAAIEQIQLRALAHSGGDFCDWLRPIDPEADTDQIGASEHRRLVARALTLIGEIGPPTEEQTDDHAH